MRKDLYNTPQHIRGRLKCNFGSRFVCCVASTRNAVLTLTVHDGDITTWRRSRDRNCYKLIASYRNGLIGLHALACQYDAMITFDVESWWIGLCAIAALNVSLWIWSAVSLHRRRSVIPLDVFPMRRAQLFLSALYVFGCAYRSVLPVYDVPRLVMHDSFWSSVLVGRSVATVAEVCLVAQLALMLNEFSRELHSTIARRISLIIVPMIVVAEVCSWYSVLTTDNIGHVFEESIWGITATLLVFGIVSVRLRVAGALRWVLDGCSALGIGYVAYMFLVDVPMYWLRWLSDQANDRTYFTIAQGFHDVATRWSVSLRWQDWVHEVIWMTLYFSVAVWMSICLVHVPHPRNEHKKKTPLHSPRPQRLDALAK